MATKNRRSSPGLIDQARSQPYRFEFFQLVRLLRLHYSKTGRTDPEARPHDDPLRFRSLLSLNFPASDVSDLRFERPERTSLSGLPLSEVQVTFMGLVGPCGVLPRPYTEMLMARHMQNRDDAGHAFLDLFSHRMTALFYQAWQKYKFHIEYERKGRSDFDRYLHTLLGVGDRVQRDPSEKYGTALPRDVFSYFSGLLAQQRRTPQNLECLLAYYFAVPCAVKSFVGRWLRLPTTQRSQLGRRNAVLGRGAVMGHRVWDYQSCLRIELGPLSLEEYQRFQPGTDDHRKLVELARFYIGAFLDIEIAPVLRADAVPQARLGRSGLLALGWLGWLKRPARETTPDRCAIFRIPYEGTLL
ncbi:type VI secretion system baseplate subunit TssG [Pseudomonas orientalis]|uniref:Type VI secretion system protein ImpH n=1 Tax=Pseudomonas orientalis TaxID=76758 RepID=A0A1H2DVM1_9PSED|nr:type VI secretion system baseplate subunit TssG [Pseudomonas orientalis]KRP62117.1 ImpH [Pseudomonas orientalis]SDT86883.1 type VI secretion system protein ImpH [Pseudomonas orientalis]